MINSIIGKGSNLEGNFKIDGVLKIEGDFKGSIHGNTQVFIGNQGKAILELKGDSITIGGSVEGNIYVKGKAEILALSLFKGNLISSGIKIEPGATVEGSIQVIQKEDE